MKGYKGFKNDLTCNGFHYKMGETHEMDGEIKLCNRGFHFCENPHDIFSYYSAGENNRFCEIEAEDVSNEKEDDSKRVCRKIQITAEISVFQICKIAVSAFFKNFGFKEKIVKSYCTNAGNYGAANAGDFGAANAGNYGAANAGDFGAANAGNYGAANAGIRGAANAGDCGAANAGIRGAANAGDCGAANAGNYGAANAGFCGAANAGEYGAANAGVFGAAIVLNNGKVKGDYGCILVARNIEVVNDKLEVTDWACGIVDNITLKENTWYCLKDGKLIECE